METNTKEKFMYILGAFVMLCAVAVIVLLTVVSVPDKNHDIIIAAVGTLLGMAVTVVGYFYGSSKSSADKTELMAKNGEPEKPA